MSHSIWQRMGTLKTLRSILVPTKQLLKKDISEGFPAVPCSWGTSTSTAAGPGSFPARELKFSKPGSAAKKKNKNILRQTRTVGLSTG